MIDIVISETMIMIGRLCTLIKGHRMSGYSIDLLVKGKDFDSKMSRKEKSKKKILLVFFTAIFEQPNGKFLRSFT